MMIDYLFPYIDLNKIKREISEKHKLKVPEDRERIMHDTLSQGVVFKNTHIKVHIVEYDNKIIHRKGYWYYLICPVCSKNCFKIYSTSTTLGCRNCCKLENKTKINNSADRILRMQHSLNEVLQKKLTGRKRKQRIDLISYHFNQLETPYKMAYNTFVFKALQEWCLDRLIDKEDYSKDYMKAVKDMLAILKDIRKILIQSGLSQTKYKGI